MAEYLLRPRLEHLPGWRGHVRSAGVNAHIGQPADATTTALMRDHGIDISEHRASQLLRQDLRQADLVLVMENHHREAVLHLDPTARQRYRYGHKG